MSVDPDVAETGQPYAFVQDDPVNASDPSGDLFCQSGGTCGTRQYFASQPAPPTSHNGAVPASVLSSNNFTRSTRQGSIFSIDETAGYDRVDVVPGFNSALTHVIKPIQSYDCGGATTSFTSCNAYFNGGVAREEWVTYEGQQESIVQKYYLLEVQVFVYYENDLASGANSLPAPPDDIENGDDGPLSLGPSDDDETGETFDLNANAVRLPAGYTIYPNG